MTIVRNIHHISNHDGKRKYRTEYPTSYDVGKLQLVYYGIQRASKKELTPHLEYECHEDFRNRGIMSRALPKYLKKLVSYGHDKLIAVVRDDDKCAEYSKKLLLKNNFVQMHCSAIEGHTAFLWHKTLTEELKRLICIMRS